MLKKIWLDGKRWTDDEKLDGQWRTALRIIFVGYFIVIVLTGIVSIYIVSTSIINVIKSKPSVTEYRQEIIDLGTSGNVVTK